MKGLYREHRVALLLTVFVGCAIGLPFILAPLKLGSGYLGVPFFPLSDEYHYLADIREILDGHWRAASVYLYEYKDLPTTMYPVNQWLYAIFALIFGLVPVAIASKFVLPAALFLLTYVFLYKMVGKLGDSGKVTAVAGALFVALGAEFVNYSYLISLIRDGAPATVSLWTRLVNPISGAVQLMGLMVLLWQIWDRRWRYAHITAGVLLALMVGYIFTFALALAILGTLFLMALARREYDIARKFVYAGAISAVLDAGWWYAMLHTLGGEAGRLIATQSGMSFTHEPVLNKAVLVASVITVGFFLFARYVAKERGNARIWLFLAALLIGSWIALNQQVVTGRNVWHHHFVQYTVPLSALAVLVSGYLALARYAVLWRAAMYLLSFIMVSYGIFAVSAYADPGSLEYYKHFTRTAPAFAWIEAHSEKDCVVLVSPHDTAWQWEEVSLPAFTHCNIYTVWDPLLAKSAERNLHNFLLRMQILGIAPEDAQGYLLEHWGDVRGSFYENWEQAFGRGVDSWVVAKVSELSAQYASFVETDIETHIKQYRADLMLSEGPLPERVLAQLQGLTLATSTHGYFIYRFPSSLSE